MENHDCTPALNTTNLREYTGMESTVTVILMPVVLLLGVVTNFNFMFVVHRVPDMRITINLYLVSLSVADVSFLAVSIIDKIVRHVTSPLYGDYGIRGTSGCILVIFFVYTALTSSELHILALAVERYYSVCVPMKAQFNPRKRAVRLIIATWLMSASFAISYTPAFANFKLYCLGDTEYAPLHDTYGVCTSVGSAGDNIDGANVYYNFAQLLLFFTSLLVSNVLYLKVLRQLRRVSSSLENRGMAQSTQYRKGQIKQHFNRMLWFNWLVYFTLSAPFQVYALVDFISHLAGGKSVSSSSPLFTTCRLLLYINSCVNPIVYGATNPRYRNAFMAAFSTKRLQFPKGETTKTRSSGPIPLTTQTPVTMSLSIIE